MPSTNTGGSIRRAFVLGGIGLTAGALSGWLTARGLPFRSESEAPPSPHEAAPAPRYANFSRVTSTAEEVIIDFCLNPNPFATGNQKLEVSHRIVLSFPTAKRLFSAMGEVLQEHEKDYGPIELDIRKRANGAS